MYSVRCECGEHRELQPDYEAAHQSAARFIQEPWEILVYVHDGAENLVAAAHKNFADGRVYWHGEA